MARQARSDSDGGPGKAGDLTVPCEDCTAGPPHGPADEITHVVTYRTTRVVVRRVPAVVCVRCGRPHLDTTTLAAVERLARDRHRPSRASATSAVVDFRQAG
jgi:YgiT-type zinc finger domain-containing protein